jgi:adenylate cyclase
MSASLPGIPIWVRPVRLAAGLLMFGYLVTHFANHALGLVGLEAMEAVRIYFLKLWRNPVLETALLASLIVHYLLGLWLIYMRKTLRMPAWEAVQILFGLAIPPLLAYHAIGTRYANLMFDSDDLYARVVLNIWVSDPWAGARQFTLLALAWTHGCIGLHYWLRIRPWYEKRFALILSAFILLPVLGALGVTQAGREISGLIARDPGYPKRLLAATRFPTPEQRRHVAAVRDGVIHVTWALLALTLAARLVRAQLLRRRTVRIRYLDSGDVPVPLSR